MDGKKSVTLLLFIIVTLVSCGKDNCIGLSNSQPNILLIISDDMGIEASPSYDIGAIKPNMPNLEQMASNGITFDNVWAYPICSPTRSSIISGRYGYRTGVLNVEDASRISNSEITIQSYLDDHTANAYEHAIIGKWHLSNNEPNRPIEMGVGYYAGLLSGATNDYNNWQFTENGQTNPYKGYITTKLTDLTIDWIDQQEKPWFCWLAYTTPHTPFHLPPSEMHSQGDLPTDDASVEGNPMPYYMAMMESLDYEMGRLLESMSESERNNTIIIFIGDNGSHQAVLQAPYVSGQSKGTLYQGGIHVPMIVSGSGVGRRNERDANLIHSADLFATVAEIAGVSLGSYEDSYSFKPLLTSEAEGQRKYNYSEVLYSSLPNKSGYTIRNNQYKHIVFDSGQQRFYDLYTDPYEQNNLLSGSLTEDQQSVFQELKTEAAAIRQ